MTSTRRTILGVGVHLIGLFTNILGAGLIYLIGRHEFTKTNARHAFNWQFIVFVVQILAIGSLVVGPEQGLEWLPQIGVSVYIIIVLLSIMFSLWATVNAIRGEARSYPFVPSWI